MMQELAEELLALLPAQARGRQHPVQRRPRHRPPQRVADPPSQLPQRPAAAREAVVLRLGAADDLDDPRDDLGRKKGAWPPVRR
jgi:hypothetical protein